MPTYEYVCSKCEHQFDVSQAITEKPLTVCPKDKCGMKRWGKGKQPRKNPRPRHPPAMGSTLRKRNRSHPLPNQRPPNRKPRASELVLIPARRRLERRGKKQ